MYQNRKAAVGFVLLLAIASMGASCQSNPPPPPPPIQQTEAQLWAKAVDYFGVIEESRHTANQVAITLSRQNPPKIPVAVLESFVKVDNWSIQGTKLLQASPNVFNQSISNQVISLATLILNELTQYNSTAAPYTALVTPLVRMESAATLLKEIK